MIYSWDEVTRDAGIFRGWGKQSSPVDWTVKLPALDAYQFFSLPGYESFLAGDIGADTNLSLLEIAGRTSVFEGLRNCMTHVSTTLGYFQTMRPMLKGVFRTEIAQIARALGDALDSFEVAVNAAGVIPVVGWIIKLLYSLAKIVVRLIERVRKRQEERDQRQLHKLAQQTALPVALASPDVDQVLGQLLQEKILGYDAEFLIRPRFLATSLDHFRADRQRYPWQPNDEDPCTDAYFLHTGLEGGLGFIPGSMNLHGGIELDTRGLKVVRDIGDYTPVTQSLAANLWSQILQGGGGLSFAVDTDKVTAEWVTYVFNAMLFAQNKMGTGWSMVSGRMNNDNPLRATGFYCSSCMLPLGWKGCNKKRHVKKPGSPLEKVLPFQGPGHGPAYMNYLYQVFDWEVFEKSSEHSVGNIDFESILPVRALRNLKERQQAWLNSINCMYLDDRDIGGVQRYKAIRRGNEMHDLWDRNVRAIFESGEWINVDYRDVIPGSDIDRQIRDYTFDMGVDKDVFFNMGKDPDKGQGRRTGAVDDTVLGDPTPPSPPDAVDMQSAGLIQLAGGQRAGAGAGGSVLALGAVVAAALFLRR